MKPTSNQIRNRSGVAGTTLTDAMNTLLSTAGAGGSGDMVKAVYDTDNDGVVDAAETVPWSGVSGKPSVFTPDTHTHVSTSISDSTTVGRAVLTAVDAAAARTAIGVGAGSGDMLKSTYDTDNDGIVDAAESVPWTGVTDKPTEFTPSAHTHTASQISDSTTVGRSVLTAADAAAARTAIGAGTGNGDVTLTGTQTLTNKTLTSPVADVVRFAGQYNAGNSGASITLNFANGQKQLLTLTANTTVTLSFPGVGNYQVILTQDGTGSRTVTWSGVSRYVASATAPAINTAAGTSTVVSLYFDGTNTWLAASKVNA